MRRRRFNREDRARRLAQAPFGAVAFDRVADFLAAGESDPDARVRGFGGVRRLQYEAGCGPFAPGGGDPEKFRAPLQPPDVIPHNAVLGRQALAALAAAIGDDAASADGRHAGAEAVAAGANQLAGLISAFHGTNSENQEEAV
jgi:hypothetical protein